MSGNDEWCCEGLPKHLGIVHFEVQNVLEIYSGENNGLEAGGPQEMGERGWGMPSPRAVSASLIPLNVVNSPAIFSGKKLNELKFENFFNLLKKTGENIFHEN